MPYQFNNNRTTRGLVGVAIPTFNRPDLIRSVLLQLLVQSRLPDRVCIHQNGDPRDYRWAIEDLSLPFSIEWLHSPQPLQHHRWYEIPLRHLIACDCSHFFWMDHDDIYRVNHIERGLSDLLDHDFSVSEYCGLLIQGKADYRFEPHKLFKSHAPGGMSSTMCFNRAFAQALVVDLAVGDPAQHSDQVLAAVTKPRFRCKLSDRDTAIYVSHEGSYSSSKWLKSLDPKTG
jgi:hypothetical protein